MIRSPARPPPAAYLLPLIGMVVNRPTEVPRCASRSGVQSRNGDLRDRVRVAESARPQRRDRGGVQGVDMKTSADMQTPTYPVQFSVDYPDRALSKASTAFRAFTAIPIFIVLAAVSGGTWQWSNERGSAVAAGAGGLLFFGPMLMIVFRQKYPRWWFDFNLELQRFSNRACTYLALMDDRYPSTTDQQSVHLDYVYPDVGSDLNRWLPLVKWFLAIPHYVVLVVLNVAAVIGVVVAWFAILFTGRYPRSIFDFVAGVFRWDNRVIGYAWTLVTDQYPPFRLS